MSTTNTPTGTKRKSSGSKTTTVSLNVAILMKHVFIPRNTPSSKNGKEIGKIWAGPKKGQAILVNSKVVQEYKKATVMAWKVYAREFRAMMMNHEAPYILGLYFVRDSKRIFDYNNASQIVCDLMQEYEWIEDDDSSMLKPLFLGYHVDPKNPGVYICLIKNDDLQQVINKYVTITEVPCQK